MKLKALAAAAMLVGIVLPAAPALAGPCVHDHTFNGNHGGSPHAHQPQCHPPRYHEGGCSFVAATDAVAGQGQMTGEIDVEAIVYSDVPEENPMSATFTCYIKVNGASQPGAVVTASGTVVVVGGGVITYTSNSVTDFVELCQDVSYSNGASSSECFEAETFEIPPPIVWEIVDPLVCPIIGMAAGTYGGPPPVPVIFINSQGDVWIDGEGFFDCPPYGNVFGFPPNG